MHSHARLAALAAKQYGVVGAGQLRDLGFSRSAVARSARAGRVHQVHRGAYAIGHTVLSDHGRCLAAILACGDGAVLSHTSAAWLWGIVGHLGTVEISAPDTRHRREGFTVHRSSTLSPPELATAERVPTTSVSRTLLDIAGGSSRPALRNAVEKTERLGLLQLDEIDATLSRRKGARGARRLRQALEIYRDPMFSRARSERLFRALVKKAGLPPPSMNTFVAGHEIDAYWEAERFAIEVDGWVAHRSRASFESDPIRQEDLKLAGIDSIRITARRIEREPQEIAARLRRLLAQRRRELRQID